MYHSQNKVRLTDEQAEQVAIEMIKRALNKEFKVADILNNLDENSRMAKLIREQEQIALEANDGWQVKSFTKKP